MQLVTSVQSFFEQHWPIILLSTGLFVLGYLIEVLRERFNLRERTLARLRRLATRACDEAVDSVMKATTRTKSGQTLTPGQLASICESANGALFKRLEELLPSVAEILSSAHSRFIKRGQSVYARRIAGLMEIADISLGMLLSDYIDECRGGAKPDLSEYLRRCPGRRERQEFAEMVPLVEYLLEIGGRASGSG